MRPEAEAAPTNDILSRHLSWPYPRRSGPYRDIIELKEGLFGTASTIAADEKAVVKRKIHGVLMAVNFVVVFPLGSLAARQVRCHWLRSHVVRAGMFYAHIITQVSGRVLYKPWCAVMGPAILFCFSSH